MTAHEVHISNAAFAAVLGRLDGRPGAVVDLPHGLARLPGRLLWLIHRDDAPARDGHRLTFAAADRPDGVGDALRIALGASGHDPCGVTLAISLGVGPAGGLAAAAARGTTGWDRVDALALVGPVTVRVDLADGLTWDRIEPPGSVPPPEGLLSRTAGALGADAFARLRRLRVALIGCGRLGSLVAEGLAAAGPAMVSLIDPDVVEEHNLAESAGVTAADVGRPKAEALADLLRRLPGAGHTVVIPVPHSVLTLPALAAVKPADLIVACADSPAARLAAAVLAAAYLKPLLDVGSAILPGPQGRGDRRMGVDVRLVPPGRCLACFGGLAGLAAARDSLRGGATPRRAGDFRAERLGSLRSLNTLAVGFAQTLLEQALAGRVRDAVWLQLDVDSSGLPRLRHPEPPPARDCPLCALAADGDAGLAGLADTLERL